MLILPDRNIPRTKLLMPVPVSQWRTPSQAQPKDQFGNENCTRFRVRARLNDGHVVWCGWFDDRADFDQFLWSIATGELWHDRYVQRLPTPYWPGLDPLVGYDFATVTLLTSPTGSNQTYNVPGDFDVNANKVECIGGGASGGAVLSNSANARYATGGQGGSYGFFTNINISGTATYQIAPTAAATASVGAVGTAGKDTWFNGTTYAGASVGATAAGAGQFLSGTAAQTLGGTGGSGKGTGTTTGGRGGNVASSCGANREATGAGGAAGPAAGLAGSDLSAAAAGQSTGGAGDNGSGGTGGSGGTVTGGNGGNGSAEWTSNPGGTTVGPGGGGQGGLGSNNTTTGGSGGNYGGGGAGACTAIGSATSGVGAQGIIIVTYTPTTPFFGGMLTDSARGRRIIIGY